MTDTATHAGIRGNAVRLKRHRDRQHTQGNAAKVVSVPADVLEIIDAEKTQHDLPGRAEAVSLIVEELQSYREREGDDRD